MEWTLASPLHDVEDIVELADSVFGAEADGILTRSRDVFRHRVTMAATEQIFNKGREFWLFAGIKTSFLVTAGLTGVGMPLIQTRRFPMPSFTTLIYPCLPKPGFG